MKKLEDKLNLIIVLIVIVAIVGAYLGLSTEAINQVIEWLISIFIGILLSSVAGSLIEAFTGNLLKKIFLNIPIYGKFKVSISAFAITTFVVKVLLFGL